MKKFIVAIFACVLACSSFVANAQNEDYLPEQVVQISKKSVNIRATPDGKVLYQAPIGTLFEVLAKEGTWYKVKEAYTGNTVYVSSTVVNVLTDKELYDVHNVPLYAESSYKNVFRDKKLESIMSNVFTMFKSKELGDCVKMDQAFTRNYVTGRAITYDSYYLGYQKGWYIVLTHRSDYEGENITPLDKPMIFYSAWKWATSIYCDGLLYDLIEDGYDF